MLNLFPLQQQVQMEMLLQEPSRASPAVVLEDPEAHGGSLGTTKGTTKGTQGHHDSLVHARRHRQQHPSSSKREQLVRETSHPGKHLSCQRRDTQGPWRTI